MIRPLLAVALLALVEPGSHGVLAADCPGNPEALGTSRILAVDPVTTPQVGLKQFTATLPLDAMEVVLTFDDGPSPTTTAAVLDALKHECVRATFFLVG